MKTLKTLNSKIDIILEDKKEEDMRENDSSEKDRDTPAIYTDVNSGLKSLLANTLSI
jgi:hypothetical protein